MGGVLVVLGELLGVGAAEAAASAEAAAAVAAETAAAEAAAATEAAAAAAAETAAAEAAAAEAAAAEAAAAEAAAAEAAAAEAAAAEAAAAEAATAEVVTVESEAGLEATIETGEEAVEAAETAAEAQAGLGSRIAKAVGEEILAGLKGVLKLLKGLAKDAGPLLLLQMGMDQVPKEQRKELAGMAMMLAAGGNQLALVAYMYMGLSGGSEEGKNVADETKQLVKDLHEKARSLKVDTPSKVPIDETLMKKVKEQKDSTKKDMVKMKGALDQINDLLKEHVDDKPIQEEGEEKK